MSDVNNLIITLEDKIHNLIISYKLIKQQNEQLINEKNNLTNKIEEQNLIINELNSEQKKALLQISESEKATKEKKEIGLKIDELIVEIDNCIENLKQ